MLDRHDSPGYMVNLLARLFFRALDRRVHPLGLLHGQFPALLCLWNQPGLTQGELVRMIGVEQPTMANTLSRMERDGLIERRPDPEDRRRMLIWPSPHALEIRDEVLGQAKAVNALATSGMSVGERDQLMALLARMIGNLEKDVGISTGAADSRIGR